MNDAVDGAAAVASKAESAASRSPTSVIITTFKPWFKPMSVLIVLSSIATAL